MMTSEVQMMMMMRERASFSHISYLISHIFSSAIVHAIGSSDTGKEMLSILDELDELLFQLNTRSYYYYYYAAKANMA